VKQLTFADAVTLYVQGGGGGDGCVSFRREKFVPKGGPDGGDGGQGGDVILRADHDEQSLVKLYYNPHQRGTRGTHGKGKKLLGAGGADKTVIVPCGTEVWDAETSEILGDLVDHDTELVVARGGKGGLGNCHWLTNSHRAPREHTDGELGEEHKLRLVYKIVSDVGLVGFPNAGKSSLIRQISDAHPKVASYPFTTLNPILGTVIFEDYSRIRVADIPGLISGAHAGVGLGHQFLRHIERARFHLYVIDMSGLDGRDPVEDYRSLIEELGQYREDLQQRPSLVVANKMDLPGTRENLDSLRNASGTEPIPISATTGEGLDHLRQALFELCISPTPSPTSEDRIGSGG